MALRKAQVEAVLSCILAEDEAADLCSKTEARESKNRKPVCGYVQSFAFPKARKESEITLYM